MLSNNQYIQDSEQFCELRVIQTVNSLQPVLYTNEGDGMNPGYAEVESLGKLCVNECRIILLRADLRLATGKKNDADGGRYPNHFFFNPENFDKNKVSDITEEYLLSHFFGHPSLCLHTKGFVNGLYGGWIKLLEDNSIEVLLSSGRFNMVQTDITQKVALERHIARRLMASQSVEKVTFVDFYNLCLKDYLLKSQPLSKEKSDQRTYLASQNLSPECLLNLETILSFGDTTETPIENLKRTNPPLSKRLATKVEPEKAAITPK